MGKTNNVTQRRRTKQRHTKTTDESRRKILNRYLKITYLNKGKKQNNSEV